MDLVSKVAIITGAARGIGLAIADFLSEKGASVIMADLHLKEAQQQAEKLRTRGRDALAVEVDVSSEPSVQHMINTVMGRYGKLDILVNNAGIINSTPIPELGSEEWDQVIDVNLKGSFLCSKLAIREMASKHSGKIIFISSLAGQVGGTKSESRLQRIQSWNH